MKKDVGGDWGVGQGTGCYNSETLNYSVLNQETAATKAGHFYRQNWEGKDGRKRNDDTLTYNR